MKTDQDHIQSNGFSFAPLFFVRFFLGRCYCDEYHEQLQIYRTMGCPHLVAIKRSDGSWHIRHKYRLFYSTRLIRRFEKNYLQQNA